MDGTLLLTAYRIAAAPALTADGYGGWTTFAVLRDGGITEVRAKGGTYIVLRVTDGPPRFRKINPAGHFKGQDPTVPLAVLRANWVAGAQALYIGKAEDLNERLACMAAYGAGKRVAHRGGRLVWQLQDSSDLIVGWRRVRAGLTPKGDEDDLIARFRKAYGKPPFANYPNRMGR